LLFTFSFFFCSYFIPVFFAHVVSSLAYPNLLVNKKLGCCCCGGGDLVKGKEFISEMFGKGLHPNNMFFG
jgi:pentatricopeptide repeat protein